MTRTTSVLRRLAGACLIAVALPVTAAEAKTYDLTVGKTQVEIGGEMQEMLAINGQFPAPLLRWTEGERVTINVTNTLDEDTSLHWHGIILPNAMDGVPGLTFAGIKPGETFTYSFTLKQSGTYWYHSHSGLQEQAGLYGPLVIDPATPDPVQADREYAVLLSDATREDPQEILRRLKTAPDSYNYSKRTLGTFFDDIARDGLGATLSDRADWGLMRMDPTDLADVTGYTFLLNGQSPDRNWTGLFSPGETVRLRFINASAMTYFDVRIPGLEMTVVQADGNNVMPVPVDAFRIAVAETYDVLVRPEKDEAYTVFAEAMDRSGYARGTLAPRDGMSAAIPAMSERQLLTMADMGAAHGGMSHGDATGDPATTETGHTGMDHGSMDHGTMDHGSMDHGEMNHDEMDHDTMDHEAPPAEGSSSLRTLSYDDLVALKRDPAYREPDREIGMRLTGNMERYIWSFDDRKFSEAEPVRLVKGERVRFTFTNETMMNHPIHLHGMWMQLGNGKEDRRPLKHVVNVPPGQTVYVDVPADAVGRWAFHCHLLYHMETGMMREFIVEDRSASR